MKADQQDNATSVSVHLQRFNGWNTEKIHAEIAEARLMKSRRILLHVVCGHAFLSFRENLPVF
jgi:hypothetical protein